MEKKSFGKLEIIKSGLCQTEIKGCDLCYLIASSGRISGKGACRTIKKDVFKMIESR